MEKTKEETGEEPVVIFTSCSYNEEDSPLGSQLKSSAEQMGGKFFPWSKLLQENRVERVKLERRKNLDNLAEEIASLGEKLAAEAGGRKTLIMIDEVIGYLASEDKKQAGSNWLALERLPANTTAVLLYNPGHYHAGKPLLLPSSCLQLRLQTTYRSTQKICELHTALCKAKNWNAPPGNPGTEVVGQLPRLVVVGDLADLEQEEVEEKIKWGIDLLAGEEEREVTVIDNDSGVSNLLARQAEDRGWVVKDWTAMFGGEASDVLVVGRGNQEAVSRARINLGILLCVGEDEEDRGYYNTYAAGYRAAIEEGHVEVAVPAWHPQVRR